MAPDYASLAYWESRYKREPDNFDWYQNYVGLRRILDAHVPRDARVLQVGVGTSGLQEDMVCIGGFSSVTNIDISGIAIKKMRQLHAHISELRYQVADVRDMSEFPGRSFDAVIDKGTLDAIMCGGSSASNAHAMIEECARVLAPGGVMVVITFGDPISRLAHFLYADFKMWDDIQVYTLSKTSPTRESDDGPDKDDDSSEGEVEPDQDGPFSYTDVDMMEALTEQEEDVHFVYVLTKADLAKADSVDGVSGDDRRGGGSGGSSDDGVDEEEDGGGSNGSSGSSGSSGGGVSGADGGGSSSGDGGGGGDGSSSDGGGAGGDGGR
ncbi:hypothetical protein FOA52_007982 [Chlamydomonas sp. UWO 241]|nr:hypothetical protein FOA52_007982 [Chlamydomonas sp. UWO 241]